MLYDQTKHQPSIKHSNSKHIYLIRISTTVLLSCSTPGQGAVHTGGRYVRDIASCHRSETRRRSPAGLAGPRTTASQQPTAATRLMQCIHPTTHARGSINEPQDGRHPIQYIQLISDYHSNIDDRSNPRLETHARSHRLIHPSKPTPAMQ